MRAPIAPYQAAVGTTAATINAGAANANLFGIEIKALAANTATVYIGIASNVLTTTGFELSPGESLIVPPTLAVNDGIIYAISGSASQRVCVAVY